MPRIRYLKPEFFDDPDLCALKPLTRLLFAGLWCWADREGRLKDEPARFKKNILGYDSCNVSGMLDALAPEWIIRYEVDGQRYIQIVNFLKHQKPHSRELPSTFPAPDGVMPEHDLGGAQARPKPCSKQQGTDKEQIREEEGTGRRRDYQAIENLTGHLSKPVIDALDAFREDHPRVSEDWIVAACEEAAVNNGRSWKYVEAILKRWEREGFRADTKQRDGEPAFVSVFVTDMQKAEAAAERERLSHA